MDRFLGHVSRAVPLPPGFRLTVASISRPFSEHLTYFGTKGGGLLLWSASAMTPDTVRSVSNPTDSTGCIWTDWTRFHPEEFSLHPILNRIRSWWAHLHFPPGQPSSDATKYAWSNIDLLNSRGDYVERKIDYVVSDD
ncbi:unnamed protein product [Echinostoma caproni]|uniref:Uncharacterized protein n=1 Tax=Echinostoma caproni TaxID=27848 RepID=A0A183AW92_9TREM|nr:unnamed protein product [Echinostoma caproni]